MNGDARADERLALNDFFVSVQQKALRQAQFAVKNREDALDIVQDAMEKLAKNYSQRPNDWGPLFQRILQNTIRDWYRKQKVKRLVFWPFGAQSEDSQISSEEDIEKYSQSTAEDRVGNEQSCSNPEQQTISQNEYAKTVQAIEQLPLRQQQAFILRAWWGHDVAETAYAMSCSEGSVKTHYSRAKARLKQDLENEL